MARKILRIILAGFALSSMSLMALGLGEIKLKSGLNQPLVAEISLLSIRGESNEQLRGKLGSASDFDRSGIERSYFLTRIKFKTITKPDGTRVIQLTTADAVKEPFLNFLVDLEWPNGRLLREYTVLLDPPIFDDAPKTVVTPVAQQPAKAKPQTSTPKRTAPAKPKWEGDVYGPTSSSDTLWGIALKVRPQGVSVQQAMITIFESNEKAFMKGNINNLKRGAEIRVPDSAVFSQISQREALRMIAVHNESWKSGKRPESRVVDTSSEASSSTSQASSSDEAESGRLQLDTDTEDSGKGGSTASDFLEDEENDLLKEQNENLNEQSRSDAEKIAQLERLLELKDEQLAKIQNRDASQAEEATTEVPAAEVTADADITSNDATETTEVEDFTPVEPEANTNQESFMDGLMKGSYNMLLLIVGAVVALLLIITIYRRRNQGVDYQDAVDASSNNQNYSNNQSSSVADDDISDTLPEIADDVLANVDVNDDAIEEEFEEPEIETDESSDPLGEAEIYLAYGKFEQAESLLLTALEEDSERLELNSKLLECYAEMKDQDKYEQHIDSIADKMSSDSEFENYVQELYQSTWPAGQAFSNDDQEFSFDEENSDDDYDVNSEDDDETSLDVDAQDDMSEYQDADLEELPSTEDVFGEESDEQSETEEANDFGEEVDIDLSNDDELELTDDYQVDDQSDSEDDNQQDEDAIEDVNTQLDLARAYVEMGDIEGTKEIIKEIMDIGSEQQCKDAQDILDSLDD